MTFFAKYGRGVGKIQLCKGLGVGQLMFGCVTRVDDQDVNNIANKLE
jgi:hypothetical protein